MKASQHIISTKTAPSLVEYLFGCSGGALQQFELNHLSLFANFRRDFIAFLDMLVEELAQARAGRMILNYRHWDMEFPAGAALGEGAGSSPEQTGRPKAGQRPRSNLGRRISSENL